MIMPMTMMILLVFTLLGTALWQYSVTDLSHVTMDDQRKQAYYLARSGADAVADFIVKNPLNWTDQEMKDYLDSLNNAPYSHPTNFGSGSFSVKVNRDEANRLITISSKGIVGNSNQVVTLNITETEITGQSGALAPIFDMAIFTTGTSTILNAPVFGDVGSNGDVTLSWGVTNHGMKGYIYVPKDNQVTVPAYSDLYDNGYGTKELSQTRQYILPQFPSFPDLPEEPDIYLNGNNAKTIDKDGKYTNIILDNNTTLTIDLGTGTRRIRVNNFDIIQGNIILEGTGKLELYVDNSLNIKGYLNGNSSTQGDPEQVMLYYAGTTKLTFSGETQLYGMLWIDSADLLLNGSGAVKGNIISGGNNIELTGGGSTVVQALYAPNAYVHLHNGTPETFKGALIAKTLKTDGGAGVTFVPLTTIFPIPIEDLIVGETPTTPNITYYQKSLWK